MTLLVLYTSGHYFKSSTIEIEPLANPPPATEIFSAVSLPSILLVIRDVCAESFIMICSAPGFDPVIETSF